MEIIYTPNEGGREGGGKRISVYLGEISARGKRKRCAEKDVRGVK